jgi:hypothetical protein
VRVVGRILLTGNTEGRNGSGRSGCVWLEGSSVGLDARLRIPQRDGSRGSFRDDQGKRRRLAVRNDRSRTAGSEQTASLDDGFTRQVQHPRQSRGGTWRERRRDLWPWFGGASPRTRDDFERIDPNGALRLNVVEGKNEFDLNLTR